MKVIELDGLMASGADIVTALLAAGGMSPLPGRCKSESSEGANPSVGIDDDLLYGVFLRFVWKLHSCGFKETVDISHLKQFDLPRRCRGMGELVRSATAADERLRAKFGDLILYANRTATLNAMQDKLPYCEIDEHEILNSVIWQERLRTMYQSVQHLCH